MAEALDTLNTKNKQAVERRDAFAKDLASGSTTANEFQTLKHKFPYYGFVECQAEDISFLMFHCNDDVVAWEYFWKGPDAYEQDIIHQWLQWSREARRILDIGAYTGLMSILAAKANPDCLIDAMEPIDRTVERTKINLVANGVAKRVTVHPVAASSVFGPEMINYYRDVDFLGTGNSIHDKGLDIRARRMIQMVNTDQYLGNTNSYDLIKIDVEGFEPTVLEGLRAIIDRDRPRMIVEVWKENKNAVYSFLDNKRYKYFHVEKKETRVMNYICTPL